MVRKPQSQYQLSLCEREFCRCLSVAFTLRKKKYYSSAQKEAGCKAFLYPGIGVVNSQQQFNPRFKIVFIRNKMGRVQSTNGAAGPILLPAHNRVLCPQPKRHTSLTVTFTLTMVLDDEHSCLYEEAVYFVRSLETTTKPLGCTVPSSGLTERQ